MHVIYIQIGEKLQNNLIYKKIDTLQKARQFALRFIYKKPDTLQYAICHENFEVGIYVQKLWHFALRGVFIKKSRHFAKSKTICVTFLFSKIRTLCITRFSYNFWNRPRGGGHFYMQKQCTLRYISVSKKQCTLRHIFT